MIATRLSAVSLLSRNLIRSVVARGFAAKVTMDKHQVVPDVIPVAPAEVAEVSYGDNVTVNEGNELTPTQVKDAPTVEWNAEADAFYTLVWLFFSVFSLWKFCCFSCTFLRN